MGIIPNLFDVENHRVASYDGCLLTWKRACEEQLGDKEALQGYIPYDAMLAHICMSSPNKVCKGIHFES